MLVSGGYGLVFVFKIRHLTLLANIVVDGGMLRSVASSAAPLSQNALDRVKALANSTETWRIGDIHIPYAYIYIYYIYIYYIYMYISHAHTHTSIHGHDFELRNISRHLQGKKRVKIVCSSQLLWFERYMSGTWVVGLSYIWPFPLSKEGHAFFRPHVLVALQKEGSKISLKYPGEVFTPSQKSNRHSPLKRAWKNDEGFFWMTKWLTNAVKSGFKQLGEEKLPWRMCWTIRRYIGSTPSECHSPPGLGIPKP